MALSNSTNVRLPTDLKARLDTVAERADIKAADLIRMAVDEYLKKIEYSGEIVISLQEKPAGYGSKKKKE